MESTEFRAARQALGLSIADFASEICVTPDEVSAMEQGTTRVPKRIAQDLAMRMAVIEREAVMRASGLEECATANDMQLKMEAAADTDALLAIADKLIAHAGQCPVCRARADYMDQHAPPLPPPRLPLTARVVGWIEDRMNGLPWPLRPPVGPRGEGRRLGVFMAVMLSAWVVIVGIVVGISRVFRDGRAGLPSWEFFAAGALIFIGYFVGFFLAGWSSDALAPIRHRFIGYVGRGAMGAAAIYGTIGLILPLLDNDMDWSIWPLMTGLFAIMGGGAGAALWLYHSIRGKLPAALSD